MPIYEYHCVCGLHFEKMRPQTKAQSQVECESCGKSVAAVLSAPEFGFSMAGDGRLAPQNTGVSAIDHQVDRVIGRDADRQWKAIAVRQTRKRKVMASNPGSTGFDLSRTFDDDYRVMRPEERRAAETARGLHQEAQHKILDHAKGKDWLSSRMATGKAGP